MPRAQRAKQCCAASPYGSAESLVYHRAKAPGFQRGLTPRIFRRGVQKSLPYFFAAPLVVKEREILKGENPFERVFFLKRVFAYFLHEQKVCRRRQPALTAMHSTHILRKSFLSLPTQYIIPPKRAQALIFQQKPALLPQKDVDRSAQACYTDFTCRQTGLFSCAHSRGNGRLAALQGGKKAREVAKQNKEVPKNGCRSKS